MRMIQVEVAPGVKAHCEFKSSGGPQCTADYSVGRFGSTQTVRVTVQRDGSASVHCGSDLGLTPEQCVATVREFSRLEYEDYVRWHVANRERLLDRDPLPAGPEITLIVR